MKKLSLGSHTQKEDMVIGEGLWRFPVVKVGGEGTENQEWNIKILKILYVNVWSSQTTKKINNLKEGTGNVDERALEYWEKPTRKFIWVTYVQKFNIVKLKEYVFNNTGRIGGSINEWRPTELLYYGYVAIQSHW